ncbi:MAG: DNA repair and recombination protein RadA [Candidatus Methanomethylicota archaeon]|uniref:DNA repair and recombination protein RadA n=1 Tax=Thermoproteota archaeon TaxID=2056631 RepID=A0A497F2L6_9CREN|nr:MAG: DNA repair and recombination protein RadA [Candidatus Verstraetearchaeota archaeon]
MARALELVKGIGPALASKLREIGITSVEALAITPPRLISEAACISERMAIQLCKNARELLNITFITADEYLERRLSIGKITTGCRALDELFGGGIETGAITEFVGEFGSGKTQLAHQLSVTVQLPLEEGGLDGAALYIDTEGTFRPERILQIAPRFGLDGRDALRRIVFARAYNSDHQMLIVDEVPRVIEERNVKLIVVDSLISHFRGEFPGRENLALRQQKLNRHIHQLLSLADAYNLAIVVTNQVMSDPAAFYANPTKPTGGHVLAHGCTYRVWLKKAKGGKRVARIFDSPVHPEAEAEFKISEDGIVDVN